MLVSPFLEYVTVLQKGSENLGFSLSDDIAEKLLQYLQLMHKWNASYNLSAIRDPEQMLHKHLLDSMSIARYVADSDAQRFIDVGTGGGLPGIPMAICFPDRSFTLLDSAGKKTRFLTQTAHTLGLKNVNVQNCRVEAFRPDTGFDVVMSRAFASIKDMTDWCAHLLSEQGKFWAMKGVFPTDELSDVEKHYKVESCFDLHVPGEIGERCLLVLQPLNTHDS